VRKVKVQHVKEIDAKMMKNDKRIACSFKKTVEIET
jgi:hypothetical protein